VCLYADGVVDKEIGSSEVNKSELIASIIENLNMPVKDICSVALKKLSRQESGKILEDMTLMLFRRTL
jgi:hypothetical protein